MAKLIISYDDTAADRDALALGRALGSGGADVALAYVRHDSDSARGREELRADEADELLARGARQFGDSTMATHVITDGSTSQGLRQLVEREDADVVVFGSEYRTARGSVGFGTTARKLLDGGPASVAIAPAGLRDASLQIARIGVLGGDGDADVTHTAQSLADAVGAEVVKADGRPVDLLVVASRPEATSGRVLLSAASEYAIETAGCPVLVLARGARIEFGAGARSAHAAE